MERERLRAVHELLLAGRPARRALARDRGRPDAGDDPAAPAAPRTGTRFALLAAALALVAAAFVAGYITGNGKGDGLSAGRTLSLVGTKEAPGALASLRIQPADQSGNWPMQISVTGLPKLPPRGYYTVYLVRDGKPFAPCGYFVVAARDHGASVWLNAPYERAGRRHLGRDEADCRATTRPGRSCSGPRRSRRLPLCALGLVPRQDTRTQLDRGRLGASGLVPHLGEEPLETLLRRVVDEAHRGSDVRVHPGDRAAHLVRDGAVRRMAFAPGAQLDQVQRLARVELEDVANAEREAERVRGFLHEALVAQPRVLAAGDLERALVLAAEARGHDLVRDVRTEVRCEPLPLAGEQAVALEVAERAVVRDDLEAVCERLEAATRPVAAVLALADQLAQELRALRQGSRRDTAWSASASPVAVDS